jgi:hypothetical protein
MKEDTTPIDFTWMSKTGGFARDMTLHDWYAGLAMQSLINEPTVASVGHDFVSRWAHKYADAMLKARDAK